MTRFRGLVHRAHHPGWAFEPLSGEGAALHGGRFNPRGVPALYTSLEVTTAWAEYQQGFPHRPQPVTLCAYEVDCLPVLDLTDERLLAREGILPETLACPWELQAAEGLTPPSWELASRLIAAGIHGIVVPSFAPNAQRGARNLVLWCWNRSGCDCHIHLIDDHDRLRGH